MSRLRLPITVSTLLALNAAAAIPQATCTPTPGFDTTFPVRLGAWEYERLPTTPGASDDYTNYQHNTRPAAHTVLVNPNVKELRPTAGALFVTENNYDFVILEDTPSPPNSSPFLYMGPVNPGGSPTVLPRNWYPTPGPSGGPSKLTLRWSTDITISTAPPPEFTAVQPSCKSTQSTIAVNNTTIQTNTRVDGLLIKQGDVIYVNFYQPPMTPFLLTVDSRTGADIDIFASTTTTLPDQFNYELKSATVEASEAMAIAPAWIGRTWSVAIYAFNAPGHFVVNAMAQGPGQIMALNVCPIAFNPTVSQRSTIAAYLRSASAYLLAGSNGNQFVNSYTITPLQLSCVSMCDICLTTELKNTASAGPASGHSCGVTTSHANFWGQGAGNGKGQFHEFGHGCYGLPDEYLGGPQGPGSPSFCGHTAMANTNPNRSICALAHCFNGHTSSSQCSPNSGWTTMTPRIYFGPNFAGQSPPTTPTANQFETNSRLRALIPVN